ncbi:MAG: TIGR04283 family arsenosugar biosynthesis glycosyltransferase [Planctomycetota bacterium]|jgi:rSAM/selenodomain-associated transferase 2
MPTIETSIIIPTLNEEEVIKRCLETVVNIPGIEVIVSDGGSTDKTVEIAGGYRNVKVVSSIMGRGVQMNAGASYAHGGILLFLHADSILSREVILKIPCVFKNKSIVGGAFKIRLLSDRLSYRLIEAGICFRSRLLKLPYGDQGLFVKRAVFKELGGFGGMAVCEDLDFIWRLKKLGEIAILDEEILSSVRRWENNGVLRTSLRNQFLLASYVLGWRYLIANRHKG